MSAKILQGHVLDVLRTLPDESVHCCVTSPPYWGLRQYIADGAPEKQFEIGLEATPAEFVARMVEVFREVRRVLRSDGVCFVNLGDSYNSGNSGGLGGSTLGGGQDNQKASNRHGRERVETLKPKDLIGIPWRVALALQEPYYAGRIKDAADRVWLAAIIDGEGCFFIHKRKSGTSAHSKHTRVDGTQANYTRTADTYSVGLEISNTSKCLIDRVAEIIPFGTCVTQGPEQNTRRKQTIYRWRLSPNKTKRLAQELYPHLVAKQHQARLIFSCPSNGEAGASAHQAMMDLHNGAQTDVDFPEPPSLFQPGWYLRQDIIWGKPNPMPESVTDRCTKAHEYVFHLTKSERYFWDAEAIRESALPCDEQRGSRNARSVWTIATQPFSDWGYDFSAADYVDGRGIPRKWSPDCPVHERDGQPRQENPEGVADGELRHHLANGNGHTDGGLAIAPLSVGATTENCKSSLLADIPSGARHRDKRSSKTGEPSPDGVGGQTSSRTSGTQERLFPSTTGSDPRACSETATSRSIDGRRNDRGDRTSLGGSASEEAASRMSCRESLLSAIDRDASTCESNTTLCSARQEGGKVETAIRKNGKSPSTQARCACSISQVSHFSTFPPALPEICIKAGCPKGGTVLDPFAGAGTTGMVADRLQRDAILIELNPDYAAMAERRVMGDRGGLLDLMEARA